MKKVYFRSLMIAILGSLAIFLIGSLVEASFDILCWEKETRVAVGISWGLFVFIIFPVSTGVIYEEYNENKVKELEKQLEEFKKYYGR